MTGEIGRDHAHLVREQRSESRPVPCRTAEPVYADHERSGRGAAVVEVMQRSIEIDLRGGGDSRAGNSHVATLVTGPHELAGPLRLPYDADGHNSERHAPIVAMLVRGAVDRYGHRNRFVTCRSQRGPSGETDRRVHKGAGDPTFPLG